MKRILLVSIFVGLLAGQASAALWELDKATALGFTTYSLVTNPGDDIGSLSVYSGPATKVSGPGGALYGAGSMSGQVGFVASFENKDADPTVTAQIDYTGSPGLSGTGYDGITSYFQNDNNSQWSYQLFYVDGSGEHTSGAFLPLAGGGGSTYLTVAAAPGSLDLGTITDLGFRISAYMNGVSPNPSSPDAYHVSVVPVPGAVLLGLLGIGVAGLKLRRFA